jgi:hypothetical protein
VFSAFSPSSLPLFTSLHLQNFDSVRALIGPRLKILREDQSKAGSQQAPPPPVAGGKPQKKKQLNPIIIISPSSTALITMHNVKQLLEGAKCVSSFLLATFSFQLLTFSSL